MTISLQRRHSKKTGVLVICQIQVTDRSFGSYKYIGIGRTIGYSVNMCKLLCVYIYMYFFKREIYLILIHAVKFPTFHTY